LARFCIAHAKQQARWQTLSAFAHPQNVASQAVLRKSGFREERLMPELQRLLYRRNLNTV
jgi:RimJ/RimL family protein N-acetyltransferase